MAFNTALKKRTSATKRWIKKKLDHVSLTIVMVFGDDGKKEKSRHELGGLYPIHSGCLHFLT